MKILLLLTVICLVFILDGFTSSAKILLLKRTQNKPIDSIAHIKAIKKQLIGIWTAKGDSVVANFEIMEDSIYYPDEFKTFKYTLTKDDTLIIYFDDFINKDKVTINKDTLFLENKDTIGNGYYIRNK